MFWLGVLVGAFVIAVVAVAVGIAALVAMMTPEN